jgi:DNA primase
MNFVKKHIGQYDMIIVVEGNMDVIALHRIDLPIGVATCGTSLTEDHIKTIKRHTDNVYFMFDNDDAGFSASVRALKIAYNQDLYPQVLQLGTGNGELGTIKDVDDFANA